MKFEKGDVLHSVDYLNPIGWIIIFDGYCPEFKYSVMLNRNQKLVYNDTCVDSGFKLANSEQKKILFDALAKENKYYCEKTKTIKEMKKEFTKKDLKSGMWAKTRNGNVYIIVENMTTQLYGNQSFCLIGDGSFIISDHIDDDLTRIDKPDFDIVSLYGNVLGFGDRLTFNFDKQKIIWQRPVEPTQKEKIQAEIDKMQNAIDEMQKELNDLK